MINAIELIREGRLHEFYTCQAWLTARQKALRNQNNECQKCREAGRYQKATVVHHKKPVRQFPDLALEPNNLLCLCRGCHEKIHGRQRKPKFVNEERW